METTIALTMKEQKRVEIIQRVFRRELRMAEGALVLGVTERHAYRVKARIRKEGVRGVVHGNRGRLCSWKLSQKNETKIVELARGKYRGFNDHHLTEKLVEEQEIEISREKVRRILRSHGGLLLQGRDAPLNTAAAGREERLRGGCCSLTALPTIGCKAEG